MRVQRYAYFLNWQIFCRIFTSNLQRAPLRARHRWSDAGVAGRQAASQSVAQEVEGFEYQLFVGMAVSHRPADV